MTNVDPTAPADARIHQPGLFAAFRTRRRTPAPAVVSTAEPAVVMKPGLEAKIWRDAYQRGRHDERGRRRASPLIGVIALLFLAATGGILYLAAREGSFAAGGQVVDQTLSQAAAPAKSAAGQAGEALESAGQSLKQEAAPAPPAQPAAP
jgi:hypothetical protein